MTTKSETAQRNDTVFINNYLRYPAVIVKGEGCVLTDESGRTFLDFLAGIAVCSLGHCHPEITRAVTDQVGRLVHVSNLYYTKPQTELGELVVGHCFGDKLFMCNSGAEANEAAIKLARLHGGEGRYRIITLEGSFHGRTLATVAATGQPKFHQGFEPLPDGFDYAPFGDIEALKKLITKQTCAIMVEPIQGESGVRPLSAEYLQAVRSLCDEHGLLLIFDEVQTGMGRCGTLFGYEHHGVVPDIMTLAKGLGNGLPIGAMVTSREIGALFVPGTHASTFGGNPVACAAAVATMKVMLADGFFEGVRQRGAYLQEKLAGIAEHFPQMFQGVRGRGMLQALVFTGEYVDKGSDIVNALFERGVLINFAGNTALRFAPPLVVTTGEIDQMISQLTVVVASLAG